MQDSMALQSRVRAVRDSNGCVIVIDDDPAFLESMGRLLRSVGLTTHLFASVADFTEACPLDCPTCLVLDVRLPGRSGLDFQSDLATTGARLPIVFITGHGDVRMSVQAMKAGALEFLTKPIREQDLLDAVNAGLARDRARREDEAARRLLRERLDTLTPRERSILLQVVEGRLNKQLAADIGITETTVKVHRSNMMRKLGAGSVAELCRMVDRLGLPPGRPEG
jgi:FixJ family two-component response regulator